MNVPEFIYAGDTVKWSESATADYSSPAYAATCVIKDGGGSNHVTLTGTASGGGWDFVLTDEQSALFDATTHWWQIYVTKDGERYTLGQGSFEVRGNIAGGGTSYDGRSQIQKDLDAVDAEIRARATGSMTIEYSIGNRSLKKESISRLLELRSALRVDLAREKQAKRLTEGVGRSIGIRFGR